MPKQLLVLLFIALSGCTTVSSVPELPENLDGYGLLVGKIYMPGSTRWDSSQITIKGRVYNARLRDGYLAIRLSPGEYTLENLRVDGWNEKVSQLNEEPQFVNVRSRGGGGGGGYRVPTYTYSPGSARTVYYTLLPINQKFTIEANRVTSLGMYVFLTDSADPKKFYTIKLENRKEMSHFLDTNYPTLMAGVANRELLQPAASYLDTAKLPDVRRAIAAREAQAGRRYILRQAAVTYGDAGTVVLIKPDTSGKKDAPPQAQILDTGTLADIQQMQVQGDRLSFLTADAQVLILDNGQLLKRTMPYRVQPQRFRHHGEKGILVVDNRRRFITSQDDGLTWEKDESAMLEKASNQLDILATVDGAYVYATRGVPDNILLRHYSRPTHLIIPGPRDRGLIPATSRPLLRSTDTGLFIDYAASEFHFKANGQTEWQLRSNPGNNCGLLAFDKPGRILTVTCNKIRYRSEDGGMNWDKTEEAKPSPPTTAS